VVGRLASAIGCRDTSELFDRHLVDVLNTMNDTYETWTQHSAQRLVFDSLLIEAGHTCICFVIVVHARFATYRQHGDQIFFVKN